MARLISTASEDIFRLHLDHEKFEGKKIKRKKNDY